VGDDFVQCHMSRCRTIANCRRLTGRRTRGALLLHVVRLHRTHWTVLRESAPMAKGGAVLHWRPHPVDHVLRTGDIPRLRSDHGHRILLRIFGCGQKGRPTNDDGGRRQHAEHHVAAGANGRVGLACGSEAVTVDSSALSHCRTSHMYLMCRQTEELCCQFVYLW